MVLWAPLERLQYDVYDIIKRVHENDLVHSGILKTYKEVSLHLFTIAFRLLVVG